MKKLFLKNIIFALTVVLMIGLSLGLSSCNDKPDNNTTPPASECAHVWSAWVTVKEAQCEEAGLTQRYCTVCSYTESQPINALGHTEVFDEAVAPTCTKTGLTQGKRCVACSKIFVAQKSVDALGHKEVVDAVVPPTCTETGLTEGEHCSTCGDILIAQTQIAAPGHNYTAIVTEPTATENGQVNYTCSVCGNSYTESIVPIAFTITNENRSMVGFTNQENENLVIPIVFQDKETWYRVTAIKKSAFSGCNKLTSITVPDSVTSIGEGAFSGCISLESITLPFVGDSIKTESDTYQYPFGYIFGRSSYEGGIRAVQDHYKGNTNTSEYSTYYIPASLKLVTITGGNILYGAFHDCNGLTSITILNGVTSIGDRAFCGCDALTSITLPNSITSIGNYAFYYCRALESITIPDSVTNIGDHAFYECRGLTNVTIGAGIKVISDYAFYNCQKLKKNHFQGNN